MTTERSVGAASHASLHRRDIDWRSVNRNVRRLQVRIVKAVEAGRWNKVKALQRLLTHSRDGKLLAVRRVTEPKAEKLLVWTHYMGSTRKEGGCYTCA
jgi:RNA-directed DNA polymerase